MHDTPSERHESDVSCALAGARARAGPRTRAGNDGRRGAGWHRASRPERPGRTRVRRPDGGGTRGTRAPLGGEQLVRPDPRGVVVRDRRHEELVGARDALQHREAVGHVRGVAHEARRHPVGHRLGDRRVDRVLAGPRRGRVRDRPDARADRVHPAVVPERELRRRGSGVGSDDVGGHDDVRGVEHAGSERLAVGADGVQDRARGRVVVRPVGQAERTGRAGTRTAGRPVDPQLDVGPGGGGRVDDLTVALERAGEQVPDEPELVVEPLDVARDPAEQLPLQGEPAAGGDAERERRGHEQPVDDLVVARFERRGRRSTGSGRPGAPESEVEPRAVQPGERAERLGDLQRPDVADEGRGAPDADGRGRRGDGTDDDVRRAARHPGVEVVLGEPVAGVPGALRSGGEVDRVPQGIGGRGAGRHRDEVEDGQRDRTLDGGHAVTCWRSRTCPGSPSVRRRVAPSS